MRLTSQLLDSRATPTTMPRIVAKKIPTTLTSSVLIRPASSAWPYESRGEYGTTVCEMSKPAVARRKSSPKPSRASAMLRVRLVHSK